MTDFGTRLQPSASETPLFAASAPSSGADRPEPGSVELLAVGGLPVAVYAPHVWPEAEMSSLTHVVRMSERERQMVIDWSTPPSWDTAGARECEPPGRAKLLVRVGTQLGIPLHTELTSAEFQLNNINKRWDAAETHR